MRRGIVVAGMLLALGLAGTAEAQDSYQSDASVVWSKSDVSSTNEMTMLQLSYRWYFEEVNGMEGPIKLQPFLQRASWVEGGFGTGDDDAGSDGDGIVIGARYVIPNSPVGVDVTYESFDANDADLLNDLRLGAVVWLNDDNNLAIEAGFAFGEVSVLTSDFTVFDVGARYVMPIDDHHLEIAGRYRSVSVDVPGNDEDGIEVETRFFFNNQAYAGLSFSTLDEEEDVWMLSYGYSFPFGLDVGVSFGEGEAIGRKYPEVGGKDPAFGLEVNYRF